MARSCGCEAQLQPHEPLRGVCPPDDEERAKLEALLGPDREPEHFWEGDEWQDLGGEG